ncbi:uncharacterized protein LOC135818446 isoform X2 [Sycon ciliatum]|uniref:uncharacterized protein LOC135818446 isoform X2 n=1 Tax=Sycon ciliatum TaxID=27933 RepID=UPI0031F67C87
MNASRMGLGVLRACPTVIRPLWFAAVGKAVEISHVSYDDGIQLGLFARFVDFCWHWVRAASACSQNVASPPPVGVSKAPADDCLADKTLRYHAGWCLVAVRRLLRHGDHSALLTQLQKFGSDVAVPADAKLLQAFYNLDVQEAASASPGDHMSYSQPRPPAPEKHLFSISAALVPFFKCLHSTVESTFPHDLVIHRSGALTALEARLVEDPAVIGCYEKALLALCAEDAGKGILAAIVKTFLKSKQKQLLKNHNLGGSHAGRALRATLRENHRTKAPASTCITPVKTAIVDGKPVDAIKLLFEMDIASRKQCFKQLTVGNLKCMLRDRKLRLHGSKEELISRVEDKVLRNFQGSSS